MQGVGKLLCELDCNLLLRLLRGCPEMRSANDMGMRE